MQRRQQAKSACRCGRNQRETCRNVLQEVTPGALPGRRPTGVTPPSPDGAGETALDGLAPALEDAVLTGLSRTQIRFTFVKLLEEVRGGGHGCRPPHPAAPARRRRTGRAR